MRKKTNKILSGVFAVVATVSAFALVGELRDVSGKAEVSVDFSKEISATYQLGESFSVPTAKFTINGTEYDTDFMIVYPDGRIYEQSENALNVLGTYTVVYSTSINGKIYKEERSFQAVQPLYEVGESSLIEYTDDLAMVTTEEDIGGLHVRLKEGEEFVYNAPINLFETPEFIKFYPYNNNTVESAAQNTFDTKEIVVRLTDCYNPNLYVEYEICYYSGIGGAVYYRGGSSTQKMAGVTPEASKKAVAPRREVFIDGVRHLAFYEKDYGCQSGVKQFQDIGFAFSYDMNTNDMRVQDKLSRLINNLSNPDIYSTLNLFEGFTTGEVYLSIRGNEYYGDEMNLDIERIGTRSGAELISANITDTVSPVIKIDYKNVSQNNISIARGEPFKLFSAVAYDIHLKGDVRTRVYYNYGSQNSQQIGVVNGAFVPNRPGEYTVVYEAVDETGNKTQELVVLQCVETENGKGVQFETEEIQNVEAGATLRLEYSLNGLNGETWLTAYAEHENGKRVVVDSITGEFVLTTAGNYKMYFEYGDALNAYTHQYAFTCLPSDNVIYLQKLILPEYFIHNAAYSIDEIFAYTFESNEPTPNKATLFVSEDGAEYKSATFENYVVSATKTVQFKVEYEGAVLTSEIVPVVEVGFKTNELNVEEYFVGGDFEKTATSNTVTFESNLKSGDNQMTFVNVVSFSAFAMDFYVPSEKSSFVGVEFTFVDYYDRNNQFTLFYRNQNGIIYFGTEAGATAVNGAFVNVWHNVSYDTAKGVFMDKNGAMVTPPKSFTTDKVIVRIALTGIKGESALQIKRFNQQAINSVKKDATNPQITVDSYSGIYSLNEEIEILSATATDVLSPILFSALTVTVRAPNGQIVTAKDGTLLNNVSANQGYKISLTQMGNYTATYQAKDQFNREQETIITLVVQEKEAPLFSLNDGYNENTVVFVSKGSRLQSVSYTVSDNSAEGAQVFVIVYAPDMTFQILGGGGEFTVDAIGDYTVCYQAYDATGNYCSTYYTVRVS